MVEETQGSYIELILKLEDEDTGRSFDSTGYDTFKVCVPSDSGFVEITEVVNANGSIVAINGVVTNGEFIAKFYPTDSQNFKTDYELNVLLEISKSTDAPLKPLKKVFKRALYIEPFEC